MARSSNPASARLWQTRLKQYQDSHLTVAQFCKLIGCSVATFYYWKRKIDSKSSIQTEPNWDASSTASKSKMGSLANSPSNFLPVVVANRAIERVSVRLNNGILVRIPCGAIEAIHAVLCHAQRVA